MQIKKALNTCFILSGSIIIWGMYSTFSYLATFKQEAGPFALQHL